ncbi:bifunctional DNA-formamidopyrimidine glycosylase/DNA-(apurinic or apyrimidinic site) lyase [Roseibium sp. RKSG952]|uniref:bifunctional DNA-formamidopyrimidine glycosylase/DNA-(apurinic or apyrimidinic site) lyase n=1 Tax=Roseibium sp. RKSG952 TaxID=2529384 RepID=UPI0012BBCA40|nr:bifunctional DNA-formamidopyrimidine glycosylase/DNA-(apurinic or apyrimidinic site) lyase [Roseibium sp. RKSG952]MTH99750.1 bifunctional DNA-formamidopyrimidine glycosylase/DNA-(apurinic or apyrimidinic site) lyase [Roseibium sp. RKSG952]
MPELPEVETVRRGLADVFEGAVIIKVDQNRPDLRFPFPADFTSRLEGRAVTSLGRRSKYLLADIEDNNVLVMHLGMSGSFRIFAPHTENSPGRFAHARSKDEKHDHVVFHLRTRTGENAQVVYNDPRRFGFMTLAERPTLESHPLFEKLGIEPLGNQLDGSYLSTRFQNKKTPLKAALLDQRIIAGLGNIYVCEALWRTGLAPARPAGSIAGKQGRATKKTSELAFNIKQILIEAIEAGGSSLRDHARTDGTLGYFQHSFAVYGQENQPCRKAGCDGVIERIVQSNRSTFYCRSCQK